MTIIKIERIIDSRFEISERDFFDPKLMEYWERKLWEAMARSIYGEGVKVEQRYMPGRPDIGDDGASSGTKLPDVQAKSQQRRKGKNDQLRHAKPRLARSP